MKRLISTKPFIICLEAVLVGVTVQTAASQSAAIPLGTSTKRADFLEEKITVDLHFFKDPYPLGCGCFLSSANSHDRCLQCLGIQRAEAVFLDSLCTCSERVTMAELRLRLSLLMGMGGAPSVTTHAGFSAMSRELSASALGDLRITVRAFCWASPPTDLSFLPQQLFCAAPW